MSKTWWQVGARAWLGRNPVQRLRMRQTSLAAALMGLCVPLLHYAAGLGGNAGGAWLQAWTVCSLGGMALFLLLIRTGWSLRCRDPSLTGAQIAFAIASGAWGYALAGAMRGACFPVLTLILMFGMFQLRPRAAYALSLFALLLFGAAMALMAWRRPAVYAPEVEFGHFLMLACMLPAVGMLTAQLSRIRWRLRQQKRDLEAALAQIRELATRDALTGLVNRRQMQQLLEREARRCERSGAGYCLAMLDLDHFKQINDRHGHGAGDAVLVAFARQATGSLRNLDVLARWGGEEFLLMLVDTEAESALAGLERLRGRIAELRVPVPGAELQISFSAGLTEHRPGESADDSLARADGLLYAAKRAGRDRVLQG